MVTTNRDNSISDNPISKNARAHSARTRTASPFGGAGFAQSEGSLERRIPSVLTNYMVVAAAACAALFFVLWWLLHVVGDATPWLPSGMISSIAMITVVVTREIIVRRYATRTILHQHIRRRTAREAKARLGRTAAASAPLNALRSLERYLLELDDQRTPPVRHLEAYRACERYLAQITEPVAPMATEVRAALRAGTERIRQLQKRHLLAWARKESQQIAADASRQSSISEKMDGISRALEVLEEALGIYPAEPELRDSAAALREYAAFMHVNRWVELAEREAFKGHYEKAIDHYRDALFDLARADVDEDARREVAEKITREVQLLHAHQTTTIAPEVPPSAESGH